MMLMLVFIMVVVMLVVMVSVMVIVAMLVIIVVMPVMVFMLHSLNDFFGLDPVAQNLKQIDYFLIGGFDILQNIVHPFIAFTADINKNVRLLNFCDVLYAGLVRV